jgi:hypothetical protein
VRIETIWEDKCGIKEASEASESESVSETKTKVRLPCFYLILTVITRNY